MTSAQEVFEKRWHQKWVKNKGLHWNIPLGVYFVTAALLEWEDARSIFAISGSEGNFTFYLAQSDLLALEEDFVIQETHA